MLDKIEMSLDDIIKANKKTKGFGGGKRRSGPPTPRGTKKIGGGSPKKFGAIKGRGGRGGITKPKYIRGDVNSSWKHDLFEGGRKGGITRAAVGGSTKLVVSNLDFSVSDGDINELFAEFGPLNKASVHYDRSGRSLGTADVIFERRNDAMKAMKQYNGVPLDGRPMNIQIASSEIRPVVQQQRSPVKRIGGPNKFGGKFGAGGARRGQGRQGGAGRGRQNAGGAGRAARQPRAQVSIDQLNAELDAYTMQG